MNGFDSSIKNICLSDFDVIKCLGSGGFSTVFLVRGNFNNKYYAMKLIDKGFIMETDRDGIVEN
jgi:serine/threonine protein kinase